MQQIQDPEYDAFYDGIKDQLTKDKVTAYVSRLSMGITKNSKPVGDGVNELVIDFGPGWRVYYAKSGDKIIILLGGGSKNGQQSDIDAAKECLKKYKKK
jgi:putative addiction module killer protein